VSATSSSRLAACRTEAMRTLAPPWGSRAARPPRTCAAAALVAKRASASRRWGSSEEGGWKGKGKQGGEGQGFRQELGMNGSNDGRMMRDEVLQKGSRWLLRDIWSSSRKERLEIATK
jgi:hypothetical protein